MIPPIKIKTKPAIFILERKDFREYPYGRNIPFTEKIFEETYEDEFEKEEQLDESKEEKIEQVETVIDVVKSNDDEQVESNDDDDVTSNNIVTEIEEREQNDSTQDKEAEETNVSETPIVEDIEIVEPKIEEYIEEEKVQDVMEETIEVAPKVKAKKALDELRLLRQERKKKAIQKIKTETRKEVVASAKEKLRDIMKRHKHVAEGLAENVISENEEVEDGRGDIPESETIAQVEKVEEELKKTNDTDTIDSFIQLDESIVRTNENIDSIVEEVIARLIDRKVYDDKTKPEDIRAEDRQIIQKIVEEVLSERMNFTNTEHK